MITLYIIYIIQTDKIQLKSTNRSSHHQVSADNWRIRYYMNLNLVKQPQHISLQYRSSSLPTNHMQQHVNSHTPPSKLPSHHDYDRDINDLNLSKLSFDQYENKTRKSIEKKHDDNDSNNDNNHNESSSTSSTSSTSSSSSSKNKLIHIVSKTKSQNNTPPRPIASMLKKHHKKSRLSS